MRFLNSSPAWFRSVAIVSGVALLLLQHAPARAQDPNPGQRPPPPPPAEAGPDVGIKRPGPGADRPGWHQRREHMLEKLKELHANGRDEEAAELKRHIAKLDAESGEGRGPRPPMDRGDERGRGDRQDREDRPRHPGRGGPEWRGGDDEPGFRERLQHVHEAVKHLQAAGFPEAAEKIGSLGEEVRKRHERRRQNQDGAAGQRKVQALQEQLHDIQQSLDALRRQVAELARDRKP